MFVFDDTTDTNRHGAYRQNDTENNKRFYYVQEMLNQVVPKKKKFRDAQGNLTKPNNYAMIPENGVFGRSTIDAVRIFRTEFGTALGLNADGERIGNTRVRFEVQPDGTVRYHDTNTSTNPAAPNNDNTSDIFRKLMKDYGFHTSPAASEPWLHKIIDKATLVGAKERMRSNWTSVFEDLLFPDDTRLNVDPENTRKDTGLYELYRNVVLPYTEAVIREAERYAGKKHSFLDEVPTSNWYSRDKKGPQDDPVKLGYASRGMSYSYGGKMNIEQFNRTVAQSPVCQASIAPSIAAFYLDPRNPNQARYDKILARATVRNNAHAIDSAYKGDLQIVNDNTGQPLCITGSGRTYYKYAGLKQYEKDSSESHKIIGFYDSVTGETVPVLENPDLMTNTLSYYRPELWAGIDCSGLVQRSISKANKLEIPGVKSEVKDLGDPGSCMVDDEDCKPCGDSSIWSQAYIPRYARSISRASGRVTTDDIQKARRGDVVIYQRHISLVYSDRATCRGDDCTYEIIHAYGVDTYARTDPQTQRRGRPEFSRKVIVTGNDITATPTGFGRIKLWD